MSFFAANCPSCAAPIEFKSGSSVVLICPFCNSAIARTDRKLEDLGRVADVAESNSPLSLGLKGEYRGNKFELTGRAQIQHSAGGTWDEWYATFSNGWVGWLAEAQGKFYLTFYKPLADGVSLPEFSDLTPGMEIDSITSQTTLVVSEIGIATNLAAEGEIPYKLEPSSQAKFADLYGRENAFATIDYSYEPPALFFGSEETLADLGLANKPAVKREARIVAVAGMSCPNCGGALDLKAPDQTERVACPYCNSLLDVGQGNLVFLKSLSVPDDAPKFYLKIGTKCIFPKFADGAEFEIIGALVRSMMSEGIDYFWQEYLLYNPRVGFRWLTCADGNWNFVEPINLAEVSISDSGGSSTSKSQAQYQGKTFRIFNLGTAKVRFLVGEFYWRVSVGESVVIRDYICPPLMLSEETTSSELNCSLSTYLTRKDVMDATGESDLPRPAVVAPNQPFEGGDLIKYGFALAAILLVVGILMIPLTGSGRFALSQEMTIDPPKEYGQTSIIESQEFPLKGSRNVRITIGSPVQNSWAEFNVELIRDKTDSVESVAIPVEYYSGYEGGESWTEGSQLQSATISSVPPGEYKLRVESTWEKWREPIAVKLMVEQSVTRGVNFWIALILLLIVPVITLIVKFTFERRRWSESPFGESE